MSLQKTIDSLTYKETLDLEIKKAEEYWGSLASTQRKKIFKNKCREYCKKTAKDLAKFRKYEKSIYYIGTKDTLYFLDKNKRIYATANTYELGRFRGCRNPCEEDGKYCDIFYGEWNLSTDKLVYFSEMTNHDFNSETTSIEIFGYLATYLGADKVFPIEPGQEVNEVYLLFNIKFIGEFNLDTLFLSHYDYTVSKEYCTFCGKGPVDNGKGPACGGNGTTMKKCSGCECVFYCSFDCQKAHWPKHKKYCRKLHPFDENCEYCVYAKENPASFCPCGNCKKSKGMVEKRNLLCGCTDN